jgi:hypothetical protein
MALYDCSKCWETPCVCGYDYQNWSLADREKLAALVLGIDVVQLRNVICAPIEHPKEEEEKSSD